MPLEIDEIAIQMRVSQRMPARDRDSDETDETETDDAEGCRQVDHEQIVADCVRRVLRALRERESR